MTESAVVAAVLLVLGAVLLTAGAEVFAEHITGAAARLGVSVLALGVLLAGAEPEEAVTAMLASARGLPELAAGDAVGANLVILTLSVGLVALLAPLPVRRRVRQYAGAAAVAGLLTVLVLLDDHVGPVEGTSLVLAYVAGVVWVWRREQVPPTIGQVAELGKEGDEQRAEQDARAVPLVLAGLAGMVVGGYLAVAGAAGLVTALGSTESVVGLTVLALATSAEMLALVWAAHRRGVTEVVVAGAVGSAAYNATVTLGVASWVAPLRLAEDSPIVTVAGVTAVLPLALLLCRAGTLPRPVGLGLVVTYAVVVAWLIGR